MTTIAIPLSEHLSQRLQDVAERLGVAPEELARAGLEEWLASRADFLDAAREVLDKNKELYRRLA